MNNIILVGLLLAAGLAVGRAEPLQIGTQLEPFFDDFLIAEKQGVSSVLGSPRQENIVLRFDEPWEGNFASYVTVLRDGPKYRMYYRGWPTDKADPVTCYAESADGIRWERPRLGLHAFGDRSDTNIILKDLGHISGNFCPFLDENPAADPTARFKAVGGTHRTGLFALGSADGIRWRLLSPEPVFRAGAFDSQNVPFWSSAEKAYVLYFRVFTEGEVDGKFKGVRTISRTTSKDFIHWSTPTRMTFGDAPEEHLYTNQTHPYYRAPHLYLAFPMRLVPTRRLLSSDEARRLGVFEGRESQISDTVFMTSRGGSVYDRSFQEAFFRPGPDPRMWVARNSQVGLGVVPLATGVMGMYRQHHYAALTNHLILYTLREDGIASLRAGKTAGYVLTKPITHAGTGLWLNYSTSAVGTVTVEVLDADAKPIAAFSGDNTATLFGDAIAQEVKWSGAAWADLKGQVIRLRITLRDADVFSLQQR